MMMTPNDLQFSDPFVLFILFFENGDQEPTGDPGAVMFLDATW
jgi:hypothetical protein